MTQAAATIGNGDISYEFRLNPEKVSWSYREIIKPFDTLGGRVLQLLAVEVGGMTVSGQAGTRADLQRFADSMAKIMRYHVASGGNSVSLKVPSRGWDFDVYVAKVPNIGWDAKTVSYPWTLNLKVEQDLGIVTETILNAELDALAKEIGYSENYHGGDGGVEGITALVDKLNAARAGQE